MDWPQIVLSMLAAGGISLWAISYHQIKKLKSWNKSIRKQLNDLKQTEHELQIKYLSASFTAQEEERKRIAVSLHDEIGASLTTIKINLETLYKKLEDTRGLNLLFNELFSLIGETIKRSKEIVQDISPATLTQFGITTAIDQICRGVNHSFVIRAKFETIGQSRRISEEREILIYRAAQELIHNALKYSNAWRVDITLHWLQNQLMMEVRDNGLGIQDYKHISSTGLTNIENRVALLGGSLKTDLSYGGTYFRIKIPYESTV